MNKIYVFTLGFHHYPDFSHLLLDFRRVVTFLSQAEGSLGGYEASEGITCFQGYALDRVHCTVVWNCHQWHGFFKVKVGVMCCSLIMRPLHLREKNSYFCQLNVNSAVFQIILGIDYECLFWILFMRPHLPVQEVSSIHSGHLGAHKQFSQVPASPHHF